MPGSCVIPIANEVSVNDDEDYIEHMEDMDWRCALTFCVICLFGVAIAAIIVWAII